jgi:hypothetical protein
MKYADIPHWHDQKFRQSKKTSINLQSTENGTKIIC